MVKMNVDGLLVSFVTGTYASVFSDHRSLRYIWSHAKLGCNNCTNVLGNAMMSEHSMGHQISDLKSLFSPYKSISYF